MELRSAECGKPFKVAGSGSKGRIIRAGEYVLAVAICVFVD